jgi:hypothetical protein
LTERFPGESKEGFAGGRIYCPQIRNIGERDTDRIATADVARLLARRRISEGKDDGVPDTERSSGGHGEDCVADSTSLNVRDPSFVRGIVVHLSKLPMNCCPINPRIRASGRTTARRWTAGWRRADSADHGTGSVDGPVRHLGAGSTDPLDDIREPLARVGEAVEVILALAAAVDETPESQESQVVAHGGLALGQRLA